MIKRIVWYSVLALVLFAGWTYVNNYIKGVESNPFQTIFRTKIVRVLTPDKPHRGEKVVTYPCVPIQAIVSKKSASPSPASLSGQTLAVHPKQIPVPDAAQTEVIQVEYPLLLTRYTLNQNLFAGTQLELYLQEDGHVDLQVSYLQPKLELGRLREFGLWFGPAYAQATDNTLGHTSTVGTTWAADLSYQQDLFRVGPAWSRLRAEAGYVGNQGVVVKAQLGIPIIRF